MNIKQALQLSSELNSDSARLDVEVLLGFVLKKPRTYLFAWPEADLAPEQLAEFFQLFERRKNGEPVAYLVGEKDFWSLTLAVNNSTLIPRADTETLVEVALSFIDQNKSAQVLDLGTGTGAIALAIAKERPKATVLGVDLSPEAVALAQKNALNNKITNAQFKQSHWFKNVVGQFELIVSNPPYIDIDDPHLTQGDVRFEPSSALVAADKGMADINHIVETARNYLLPSGVLLLEHGWQQSEAVQAQLELNGYENVRSWRDYSGIERVTGGAALYVG